METSKTTALYKVPEHTNTHTCTQTIKKNIIKHTQAHSQIHTHACRVMLIHTHMPHINRYDTVHKRVQRQTYKLLDTHVVGTCVCWGPG